MTTATSRKSCIALASEATGRVAPATVILYMFRYGEPAPEPMIERGGYRWLARSAEDWSAENGLTVYQVRRGVSRLRFLDLIQTRQCRVGERNITHMRLTDKALVPPEGAS